MTTAAIAAEIAALYPPNPWRLAGFSTIALMWDEAFAAAMAARAEDSLLDELLNAPGAAPPSFDCTHRAAWLGGVLAGHIPWPPLEIAAVPDGDQFWRPPVNGERAKPCFGVPVLDRYWDEDGNLMIGCVEILALDRRDPARWRRRTDLVPMLGEGAAESALLEATTLLLYQHPLAWMIGERSAPGEGACILDWTCPLVRQLLTSRIRLVADSEEFAAVLHKRSRSIKLDRPRIEFVQAKHAAAA